ncbi:Speckle-type POZ protein [Araneus ventricosus]|uniref:Speckle-type POZ protein n=1 Tax=Araneus ventricosus TaxID=182803 RepID=A0A4Y2PC43_ARAVE|nr:Speckle-type POZ protein [Araneus ventricosus]
MLFNPLNGCKKRKEEQYIACKQLLKLTEYFELIPRKAKLLSTISTFLNFQLLDLETRRIFRKKMKEFIFTWSIENISFSWHNSEEKIISPSFTAGPIQNSAWTLWLRPRGNLIGDYLSVFLHREEDNGPEILSVNFELSCVSADKSLLHSHVFPESDKAFKKNSGFGHPRFMRRNEVFFQRKDLYLPRDVLTLRCRIWQNESNVDESGESFGFTRLDIERVLTVENINPQILKENTVCIDLKCQNKTLMSISTLHYGDTIGVEINPTNVENIKFSVLKLSFMEKINKKLLSEHLFSWMGEPLPEFWRLPVPCELLDNGNEDSVENNVELVSEFVYSTGQIQMFVNACPHSSRFSELVSKYINSCIPSGNLSDAPRITQDLWNLYVDHVFCDVELKTQTTSFFVHKIVLCARSPVFLAMFTDDLKEKRNRCIEIEDIMDDILEKFIFFLYTDGFDDLEWEAVIGLYYAADKYHVERLKILCCSYLLKNVDVDNVCELLMLADKHHDSDFKRRVEDFILQNDERIFSSSTWKQFVYEQPLLPATTMLLRYDKERERENSAETYDTKLSRLPNVEDDFVALYQDETISDVIIKTTGTSFPAHKSVLCGTSATLIEMFTKDLKDKSTDIFEIHDWEDNTFSRLLLFLYTDSLGDAQWDIVLKLYHVAGIYQIQRLKIRCSCFLLENIETSNASDLLLLAHNHRDVKLKSVVEDYILMHDEEIFGSDGWADFSETNFRLANETMRDVQWDAVAKFNHVADMYQIQRSKMKCSCFLLENLETSNAIDLLLLAHDHQDARFKPVVVGYILIQDEEIIGPVEWADFNETDFRLANETMHSK